MKINEAIKEIQRLCCNEDQYYTKGERKCKDNCMYGENFCPFQMAIKAMEVVEEYQRMGTVEEIKELFERAKAKRRIIPQNALDRYYHSPECPNCGKELRANIPGYTMEQAIGKYNTKVESENKRIRREKSEK